MVVNGNGAGWGKFVNGQIKNFFAQRVTLCCACLIFIFSITVIRFLKQGPLWTLFFVVTTVK